MRNVILMSLGAAFFMNNPAFAADSGSSGSGENQKPKSCISALQVIDNSRRYSYPDMDREIPTSTSKSIFTNMISQNYEVGIPFFSKYIEPKTEGLALNGINIAAYLTIQTLPAKTVFLRRLPTVPSNVEAVLSIELRTILTPRTTIVMQARELEQGQEVIQGLFKEGFMDTEDLLRITRETASLFGDSVLGDQNRIGVWRTGSGFAVMHIKLDHITAAEFDALINKLAERIQSWSI